MNHSNNTEKPFAMSLMTYALEHAIEDIFATKADGTLIYANGQFRLHHGLRDDEDVTAKNIKDLTPFPQTAQHWEYILAQVEGTSS